MTLAALEAAVAPHGLFVMGVDGRRALLGTDAVWWSVFCHTAEARDGAPDPVDRWSKRVIGKVAEVFGAQESYPSDGPPYAPFIAWALATGRFWQSPTGMMVHDTAGLMISIRGALEFAAPFEVHRPRASPCDTCADRPCINACPVGALGAAQPYDVPICKAYLKQDEGQDCMDRGCAVRRACPVSQTFDRNIAQSAFHMKAFLG
ncbi:ferredoxin [uncultured Tateyamaria sp.]|uniref:ferredoxin n=1 Tax=Tateyamaria sp. 1078 TaxID=3417464 RepID=UPI00261AA9BC|nr:ferredoxin [uncultured Tateyamaria sp.]